MCNHQAHRGSWSFLLLILREFGPMWCFGTHFHGVPKIVLEVVYSKYGYSEAGRVSLRGFCDRRAPKRFRHQIGPLEPLPNKNRHFRRFFSSGVPGGCTYFSERPALQTHPIGPYLREKSCPTSIWYLVPKIIDFKSQWKGRFIPPPGKETDLIL